VTNAAKQICKAYSKKVAKKHVLRLLLKSGSNLAQSSLLRIRSLTDKQKNGVPIEVGRKAVIIVMHNKVIYQNSRENVSFPMVPKSYIKDNKGKKIFKKTRKLLQQPII